MRAELKKEIVDKIQKLKTEKEISEYAMKLVYLLSERKEVEQKDVQSCAVESLLEKEILCITHPRIEEFFLTDGLHVIAGPTAHGKTFWAMEWAREAAKQGHDVLFASLEMTFEDIGVREVSHSTGIAPKDLYLRRAPNKEALIKMFSEENDMTKTLKKINVLRHKSLDWAQIELELLREIRSKKPKLVIVDYMQMLEDSSEDVRSAAIMYTRIARKMKIVADTDGVCFLLLAQVNREAFEAADNKKAIEFLGYIPLSSRYIKESGGVAEAADSVQMICIPEKFVGCPASLRGTIQIWPEKSRKLGYQHPSVLPFDTKKMQWI